MASPEEPRSPRTRRGRSLGADVPGESRELAPAEAGAPTPLWTPGPPGEDEFLGYPSGPFPPHRVDKDEPPNTEDMVIFYDGGPFERRIKVEGNNTNIDVDDMVVLFDGFMIGTNPFPPTTGPGFTPSFPPPGHPWEDEWIHHPQHPDRP